eukprot:5266180-Amphidinium_carterae.1
MEQFDWSCRTPQTNPLPVAIALPNWNVTHPGAPLHFPCHSASTERQNFGAYCQPLAHTAHPLLACLVGLPRFEALCELWRAFQARLPPLPDMGTKYHQQTIQQWFGSPLRLICCCWLPQTHCNRPARTTSGSHAQSGWFLAAQLEAPGHVKHNSAANHRMNPSHGSTRSYYVLLLCQESMPRARRKCQGYA